MSTLLKLDIIFFSWICFKNELQLLHLALSNMQIFSAFTCSLAPSSGRVGALWSPVTSSFGCVLLSAGVSALSAQLAKLPMGLKHLSLSRTSMSPKGEHAEAQRCKLYSCSELFLHECMFVVSCRCEQPLSGSLCQPGCRFHPHTPRPVGKLAERRRPAGERHLPSFCHIQRGDKLMCWVCLSRCLMCLCFLHRTCTVSWVTQTVWRLWICPTATALWSW